MKIAIHKVCDEFDALTEDESKRLKASLKKHGCKQPVLMWKDRAGVSHVMDGRHRVAMCKELDITYPFTTFDGTEEQAMALARSLNKDRRHRPLGAVALAAAERANAPEGRRESTTANAVVTQEEAAKDAGISVGALQRAAVVLANGTPELIESVRKDEIKLGDAATVAKEPPAAQRKAIKAVKSGKAKTARAAVKKNDHGDAHEPESVPAVEPMDDVGNPIPRNLRDTFAGQSSAVENAIKLLQDVRRTVKNLQAWNPFMRPADMETKLDELIEDFKNGKPYAVCQGCKGKGCKDKCRTEGWIPKWLHKEMAS